MSPSGINIRNHCEVDSECPPGRTKTSVSSHIAPVTSDRIQKGEHQNLPPVHNSPGVLLGWHPAELLDPCNTQCWQQLLMEIGQFNAEVHHWNTIFRQPSLHTSSS